MDFKEANSSLAFEDVEAFQKINIKHNQKYVEHYKKWVEKEASLLDLAHNIIDYYDYWYLYRKERNIEIFRSFFELGEDYVEQALNFIRIYLESENMEKLSNMYISLGSELEGCYIFRWCFSDRYIWENNYDSVASW